MGVKRQHGDMESKPLLNPSVHQSSVTHSPVLQPHQEIQFWQWDFKICKPKSSFISGQCFMEGWGDFSPKVSPARLWLNADLCSSVEEGEKQECDTEERCFHHYSENWRAKIPFVNICSARERKIRSPGWWLLCDTRAGLAIYLENKYFCSSPWEGSVFSLGLC